MTYMLPRMAAMCSMFLHYERFGKAGTVQAGILDLLSGGGGSGGSEGRGLGFWKEA